MRPMLARPLGRLYPSAEVGGTEFNSVVRTTATVVTVGDKVTETLWRLGRVPDIQVVDSRENRKERTPPEAPYKRLIRTSNPAGTITQAAIDAIREAFAGERPCRVLVEGEEDLLAVPAVVLAPDSASVFYGQPGVGMVQVVVTEATKSRNREILREMGVPALT